VDRTADSLTVDKKAVALTFDVWTKLDTLTFSWIFTVICQSESVAEGIFNRFPLASSHWKAIFEIRGIGGLSMIGECTKVVAVCP
jgi:hypothetical protein